MSHARPSPCGLFCLLLSSHVLTARWHCKVSTATRVQPRRSGGRIPNADLCLELARLSNSDLTCLNASTQPQSFQRLLTTPSQSVIWSEQRSFEPTAGFDLSPLTLSADYRICTVRSSTSHLPLCLEDTRLQ
ncbi:hypothetical protein BDZ85DRAFT_3245 [Elsinoe ampelina]|uniref:Uncharacterized protein n=1 Tax=Elsinoe ampelina TaxID=302913 RepID=A0A6A6GNU9_9PEZI|nr:hypothetical protein BDZ85DRAFT_3245 [Elsinoe ampelina]